MYRFWRSIFFLLLFCNTYCSAQTPSVNATDFSNLNRLSSTGEVPDTGSIGKLILFSKRVQNENPDTAILLNRKAFVQSLSIGYYDGAAAALLSLAAQLSAYKQNIRLSKEVRDQAYYFIQRSVYNKGKMLSAYYLDQGVYYLRLDKFDSGILYLQTALNVYRDYKVNSPKLLSQIYSNLAGVFSSTNRYEYALTYAKKGIALQKDKFNPDLISSYVNIAQAFFNLDVYDSAIHYAQRALDLCLKYPTHHSARAQTFCYVTIGAAKKQQRHYDEALQYFRKGLEAEQVFPSFRGYLTIYQKLAELFADKEDHLRAEQYYKKAIEAAKAYEVGGMQLVYAYDGLAKLYHEQFQNDKLAYHYKELAVAIRDSFETAEQKRQVTALDARYQSAEKDRALSQQKLLVTKKEHQLREKNIWIILTAVSSILAVIIIVIGYRNGKHRQRLQEAHIKDLEQAKEITTLQHIIAGEEQERSRLSRELHDGIMVLFSAIRMKLRQLPKSHKALNSDQEFNDLNDELEQAIRELRRTAHNLMPDMLLDGGLAEAVFYFCKSLQQNSPLQINFQQYGSLPRLKQDAELSLYRIIQELLQNIIRHADANKALVQLNYRDELLCITIEDNGKGFDQEDGNLRGVGLRSIETRLKALKGSMDIRSSMSGTTVYLEFYLHAVIKPTTDEPVHH